jgi:hypothetical protein
MSDAHYQLFRTYEERPHNLRLCCIPVTSAIGSRSPHRPLRTHRFRHRHQLDPHGKTGARSNPGNREPRPFGGEKGAKVWPGRNDREPCQSIWMLAETGKGPTMKCLASALALVLLATPVLAQSVAEKTGVNSALGISPTTADFVKEAAISDMVEIQSSQLAQAPLSDISIRSLHQRVFDRKFYGRTCARGRRRSRRIQTKTSRRSARARRHRKGGASFWTAEGTARAGRSRIWLCLCALQESGGLPAAASIADAIANATGKWLRNLPLTRKRIKDAIDA